MRILLVNDDFESGGASILMQQLAEALILKGHKIYFAVGGGPPSSNVYKLPHFKGILSHLFRRLTFFNLDPLSYYYLEKVVKKIKPNVIHCQNLASHISLEIVKVAFKFEIPCVVCINDFWPVCLNRALLKGSWNKLSSEICQKEGWHNCHRECKREALKRGPLVELGMINRRSLLSSENVTLVAVSNYVKNVLKRFGYLSNKIKVVYPGIDVSTFRPLWRQHARKKRVLFVGATAEGYYSTRMKGIEHFVRAAMKIRNRRGVKFVHVGKKFAEYQNLIESYGKIPHGNMVSYYQKAFCLCMPTLYVEACPLVALEAMACAKPVVAYASGGLVEIVKDGRTGYLVERENFNELTEKILWLLDHEDVASDMGINARKCVEERFSLKKMCDEYEKIYYNQLT